MTEAATRRQTLMTKLGNGVAIVPAAELAVMHNDVEYPFRQNSDFYYLTGFNEPHAVAVIAPHHPEHPFVLFVQPKDRTQEIWTGYRVGKEGAVQDYGAAAAFELSELETKLSDYLQGADAIYYHPTGTSFDSKVMGWWRSQLSQYPRRGRAPLQLHDLAPLLHSMRCIKSEAEIALMRKAAAIAADAHNRAREATQPGMYEYEIEALIAHEFRKNGAWGAAYPSIVAAGANACVLHYVENASQMQADDLLLIDAGCSYDYYSSDITRTFPVGGRFSPPQQALYELVLAAQEAAIAQVKPGNTYNQPHDTAVRVLTEGLVELGLLPREDIDGLIDQGKYRPFYMHRTGHWLGLDVHDVGVYKIGEQWQTFQPGMVLTVEPGLYVSPDRDLPELAHVGAEWRGIGIRIEDDVLVTETGAEVLTAATPKSVAAISR